MFSKTVFIVEVTNCIIHRMTQGRKINPGKANAPIIKPFSTIPLGNTLPDRYFLIEGSISERVHVLISKSL